MTDWKTQALDILEARGAQDEMPNLVDVFATALKAAFDAGMDDGFERGFRRGLCEHNGSIIPTPPATDGHSHSCDTAKKDIAPPESKPVQADEDEVVAAYRESGSNHVGPYVAFHAGYRAAVAKAEARIAKLERENEYLRRYGNKDCTAQADQALEDDHE